MDRYPVGCFEPSVAERVFTERVAATPHLTVWLGRYPEAAMVREGRIESVIFGAMDGGAARRVLARHWVDATYEGDLLAVAGAPYRVGREGHDEFGEPHAGVLFTQIEPHPAPSLAIQKVLNLVPFGARQGACDPASPRTADRAVQAYNLRACVCRDPARCILLDRPPEGYDRTEFLTYTRRALTISCDLNGKNSYNAPILPGENWDYPEGDWDTRACIAGRHRDFALGLMWFLQNDESVPSPARERFRAWGLPSDEFVDNGHLPWEIYVREARRLVGRHVLTENDLLPRPGLMRPRPFPDSVAFTDWYMDSHSCRRDLGTWGNQPGVVGSPDYPYDGKLILTEEFRPGQVPYRSLVCDDVHNLIVPVCASATHVAWGSIRLEPIWIHLGEVAGFACLQALARQEALNALDVTCLQQSLLDAGVAIAFFNQHRQAADRRDYAERQLAVCHGEWDSYDLDPS